MKTYSVRVTCGNCNEKYNAVIPKKVRLSKIECRKCGCFDIRLVWDNNNNGD